jgi:hypothetical protein
MACYANKLCLAQMTTKPVRPQGAIPDMFADLKDLEFVWLNQNFLNGAIPESLAVPRKLRYIYVSGNAAMEGTVPTALAQLPSLEGLYVSQTNITGRLSCAFGKIRTLKNVDAKNTRLQGCLDVTCLQGPECQDDPAAIEASPKAEL